MITFQLIGGGFIFLFLAALVSNNEAASSR
jgi:hypothetical protein